MGCDFTEETCLEITWINSSNETITSYYVIEDLTKYKYFQVDSANIKDLESELQIKFQPVEIVINKKINYELDQIKFQELALFEVCGVFEICQWVKTHLLNWINQYTLLEDIIEGKYECKFNTKITGIKLIKRNCYLSKYYYHT